MTKQTLKQIIREALSKAFSGNEFGSANEKKCKHCKKYFDELGLSCTAAKYGECNCPICQGFCQCGEESEDEINEAALNEGGNYGWKSQIRGFTKEYVLTSDNVDEPAAAVVYKRTDGSGKWTAKIYRNNHLEMVNHFMSEREAKNWAGDWIGVYPGLSEAADKKESPRQATQRRFRQYAGEPRKTKDNETPKERMQRRLKQYSEPEQALDEVAPPGKEQEVLALKKKFPKGSASPFKIAWAQHNKGK